MGTRVARCRVCVDQIRPPRCDDGWAAPLRCRSTAANRLSLARSHLSDSEIHLHRLQHNVEPFDDPPRAALLPGHDQRLTNDTPQPNENLSLIHISEPT